MVLFAMRNRERTRSMSLFGGVEKYIRAPPGEREVALYSMLIIGRICFREQR